MTGRSRRPTRWPTSPPPPCPAAARRTSGCADGRSLLDAIGPGYTLLRLDPALDAARGLQAAAERRACRWRVLDLEPAAARAAGYDHALVLSRPDWHVAWRGDAPPADPAPLVDRLRGAAPAARRLAA